MGTERIPLRIRGGGRGAGELARKRVHKPITFFYVQKGQRKERAAGLGKEKGRIEPK